MMSQNRQAAKDSLRNQNDYRTDLKSELILEELHDKMEKILDNQKKTARPGSSESPGHKTEREISRRWGSRR